MGVITVIKKIGERIISLVEAPFEYAEQTEKILSTTIADEPKLKAAIVGTVAAVEKLGPDVLAALAAHGLDVPDDLKSVADVQALFAYIHTTLWPEIEATVSDYKADVHPTAAPASTTQTQLAAQSTAAAPGLHNVTPA